MDKHSREKVITDILFIWTLIFNLNVFFFENFLIGFKQDFLILNNIFKILNFVFFYF